MIVSLDLTANGLVRVEPSTFLTGQGFSEFQAACRRGGYYFLPRPVPAHYGSVDNLQALIKSLKTSGFSPQASADLLAHLTQRANRLNQWKVDMATRAQGLAARDLRMKPYQVHDAHVVAQKQALLIAHEMRVGKSIVTLAAAPDNAALVIVCPKTAKLEWIRTIHQWRPDLSPVPIDKSTSFRWPVPGEAVVVHYDALPAAPVRTSHETICIIDECFPAGTPVLTDQGPRPIETLRPGDNVLSHKNGTLAWKPVVRTMTNPLKGALVKIHHDGGTLVCTSNHKIWSHTKGDYVRAEDLSPGEELLLLPGEFPSEISVPDLLLDKMQQEEQAPKTITGDLPHLPVGVRSEKLQDHVLLRSLSHNGDPHTGTCTESSGQPDGEKISRNLGTYDGEQPDAGPARAQEGERISSCAGPQTSRTWRERERTDRTPSPSAGNAGRSRGGARDPHTKGDARNPEPLQSRSRASRTADRDRTGRVVAQQPEAEGAGRTKRPRPVVARVDRVEILEHRGHDRPDCRSNETLVYNIEVADYHNYFADNVLVSNCHRCKNTKTIVYKKTKNLVRSALNANGKCWLTTGTPILNKQPELWAILQLANLGNEAFGSWVTFCRVMGGVQGVWGMEWGEPTPKGRELLKTVMIRRTREEVGMGAEPSYEEICVPVSGLVEEELNAFERVLSQHGLTLAEVVNLTAGAAAAKNIDFTMIARVRSAVAAAKIPAMMRAVAQHEHTREPLVIFSSHRAPVNHLRDRPGWGVITGEDSTKHREETIAAFKRGELLGVGLTIKACGVALDLTRSAHALFVDRDWVPANNAQAESRLAGHDQKNPVTIATLVADHPIEHRLYEILMTKQGISDEVLGR